MLGSQYRFTAGAFGLLTFTQFVALADLGTTGPVGYFSGAVLIGGQVGCDLQFARNWVIGAQIDGAWTNLTATQGLAGSQSVPGVGTLSLSGSLNLKANVIATATGRIGYATNFDTMAGLFYLKGGAAFVNFDTSNFGGQATITPTGGGAPLSGAVDFSAPSANRWGWTIGVGTEWALAENWSIVGEWDFLDFGTQTLTFTDPNLGGEPSQCQTAHQRVEARHQLSLWQPASLLTNFARRFTAQSP